jgi:hypothetical protein
MDPRAEKPLPRGPATVARAVLLVAGALLIASCSTGAETPIPGAGAMGSLAPSGPGASGSAGCAAAPARPADQEGWTTAPSEPSVFPVVVNSSGSLTCGENRLLFTFLDGDNRPVAQPDRGASVALYNLGRDGATPIGSVEGSFVWGIENERGFYVASVSFPEAGEWGAEFTTAAAGTPAETIRMIFEVATSTPVVRVGAPAPATETPTADSVGGDLARISTDQHPEPTFYQRSVKDALAAGEPFMLIFATPKFCASAQCGPTLDRVKPLAAEFPGVRFINVEPYELAFRDGSLQPVLDANGGLQPVPAVLDWGILSEPWVFVVDRDGIVTGSFEGVVGMDELRAAIAAVR